MKMFSRVPLLTCMVVCILFNSAKSIGDALFITPSGVTTQFVDRSIIYDCVHSRHLAMRFDWKINGTPIQFSNWSSYQVITYSYDFSELFVHGLPAEYNNTEIQCQAILFNNESIDSETTLLLLQGNVSQVTNFKTIIDEDLIYFTWIPPFSLTVSGSTQIQYIVTVQNLTFSNGATEFNIKDTNYTIASNSSRRIGCDNFNISVTPENPVGFGESTIISLIYDFPEIKDVYTTLNSEGLCNFVILMDAPMCEVINFTLRNNASNDIVAKDIFNEFILINATPMEYLYSFNLNLQNQLQYQLDFVLSRSNKRKPFHFEINTVKDVCATPIYTTNATTTKVQEVVLITAAIGTAIFIGLVIFSMILFGKIKRKRARATFPLASYQYSNSVELHIHQLEYNDSVVEVQNHEDEHEQGEIHREGGTRREGVRKEEEGEGRRGGKNSHVIIRMHQHGKNGDKEKQYTQICMSHFFNHMSEYFSEIEDQFKELYGGFDKLKSVGMDSRFQNLNRVSHITVYDDNRIELQPLPGQDSSLEFFINASYIDGFDKQKKFIATQGPMEHTVEQFWHMIWQERASIIVMLTDLNYGSKCLKYWSYVSHNGSLQVQLTEKAIVLPYYILRILKVMSSEEKLAPLQVHLFQFTDWAENRVPLNTLPLLNFYHEVMHYAKKAQDFPIVVQCSSGVGPTGVFIAMDRIIEQAKKESVVDIMDNVTKIRHQRMEMVQTLEEYWLIHVIIREYLFYNHTERDIKHLENLEPIMDEIKDEFQNLQLIKQWLNAEKSIIDSQLQQETYCNMTHNDPDILKFKKNFHTIFVEGHKEDTYIVAENPTSKSMAENMLNFLYQQKYKVVIMLSELFEDDKEVCYRYWPKLNMFSHFGSITVDGKSENKMNGFFTREIVITKDGISHKVKQFQIQSWQSNGKSSRIKEISDVLHLLSDIDHCNSPIFIHCDNINIRSAMFCAMVITCKSIVENKMDAFQAVRKMCFQNTGVIPTLDNYKMIYEVIYSYLTTHVYGGLIPTKYLPSK